MIIYRILSEDTLFSKWSICNLHKRPCLQMALHHRPLWYSQTQFKMLCLFQNMIFTATNLSDYMEVFWISCPDSIVNKSFQHVTAYTELGYGLKLFTGFSHFSIVMISAFLNSFDSLPEFNTFQASSLFTSFFPKRFSRDIIEAKSFPLF